MINDPYLTYIGNPNAPAPLPDTDPRSKVYSGGPLVDRAMPGTPQQGMFQPMMPMYQPQPTDGISSAVGQISGGMGDEYANRLLAALGLGDVGQYQMQQPMYQPMPYFNPYAGMFSPFMQQTQGYDPSGESQLTGPDTPYQSNPFMRNLAYGLYNMPASPIANFFGKHMLKADNRASLASVTGDNFSSDGPTGGQAGRDAGGYGDFSGRDSDGWGE